jgi:hypothetical protein
VPSINTIGNLFVFVAGIYFLLGAAGIVRTANDPAYEKQTRIIVGILGIIFILLAASINEAPITTSRTQSTLQRL